MLRFLLRVLVAFVLTGLITLVGIFLYGMFLADGAIAVIITLAALVVVGVFVYRFRNKKTKPRDAESEAARQMRRTRFYVALQLAPTILIAIACFWIIERSYRHSVDTMTTLQRELDDLSVTANQLGPDRRLEQTGLILDRARKMQRVDEKFLSLPRLNPVSEAGRLRDHYHELIGSHFRTSLMYRLEQQMSQNLNNPRYLNQALRVYLMLGQAGPTNDETIRVWMHSDWATSLPGQFGDQEVLQNHLNVMLGNARRSRYPLNVPLIETVRVALAREPLASRAYWEIIDGPDAKKLPQWEISEHGGPDTARVFTRASGRPLTAGVEGLYTRRGFHEVLLTGLAGAIDELQQHNWVLGDYAQPDLTEAHKAAIAQDILSLYYSDYVRIWSELLADIDIIHGDSLAHSVQITNLAASPESPVLMLMRAISAETKLAEFDDTAAGSGVSKVDLQIIQRLSAPQTRALARVTTLLQQQGQVANELPGQFVDDYFGWLHQMVDGDGDAPSELADFVGVDLWDLYGELYDLDQSNNSRPISNGLPAADNLRGLGRYLSAPLNRWSIQFATLATDALDLPVRSRLGAEFSAQVSEFCEAATQGRYPFAPGSSVDTNIQDFNRLFSPGGIIDSFFNANLNSLVDRSQRPWRWRAAAADLQLSDAALRMFENAAEIRDVYFSASGSANVTLSLSVEALDPRADGVEIKFQNDEPFIYRHSGPGRDYVFSWPETSGVISIELLPDPRGKVFGMYETGSWALLRLFDNMEIRRDKSPDTYRVIADINGRIVILRIRASSVLNPFNSQAIRNFTCVSSL